MTENLQEALRQCLAYVGEHYDPEAKWDDPKYVGGYDSWLWDQAFLYVFGLPLSKRLFDATGQAVADEELEENEAEAEQAEKRMALLYGCLREIFRLYRDDATSAVEARTARMAVHSAISPGMKAADQLDQLMDSTPELAQLSEAMSLMSRRDEPSADDLTKTDQELREGFLELERIVNGTVETWLINIPGGLWDATADLRPPAEGEEDWRFMGEQEKEDARIRFYENAIRKLPADSRLAKASRRRLSEIKIAKIQRARAQKAKSKKAK